MDTFAYQFESIIQKTANFQRHQNDVWNDTLSFEQRISNIPLYGLEFNNHDRDPKLHGPTIAHYAPSRQEMSALSTTILENVKSNPKVLDIGCGNGFIGSLLAREGLAVTGIDNLSWNLPQIPNLYDKHFYDIRRPASLEEYDKDFNVAFCSWMIPNSNLTTQIVKMRPQLIIHTYSIHKQPDGSPQTGCKEAFLCPKDYRVIGGWTSRTPANFFSEIDARLQNKSATIRITEIWCYHKIKTPKFIAPKSCDSGYSWDKEREFINKIRCSRNLDTFRITVNQKQPILFNLGFNINN